MIEIITDADEIDRTKWEAFVDNHPNGSIFQSPAMYDFLSTVRRYKPIALAAIDAQKMIHGILLGVIQRDGDGILGSFSSRAVVWGGPLLNMDQENHQGTKIILREFVRQLKWRSIYIEFRNLFDATNMKCAFELNGFSYREHLNFVVNTTTKQNIESQLSASRRRQIKKSLSRGTKIVQAESSEQVEEFYRILINLYKKKVHKPLPDWTFFKNFHLSGGRLGVILLVVYEDKVIGGILCPIYHNIGLYEWFVCGLDEEYSDEYPSVMATWAAIEYAQKNGLKYFDFMGAGRPDQNYGVREFKARFGGSLVSFGRFIRINNKLLYKTGELGLKIMRKLNKL